MPPGRRAASSTNHLPLARRGRETEQPPVGRQTLWPLIPSHSASVSHCTKVALTSVVGSLLNRSSTVKEMKATSFLFSHPSPNMTRSSSSLLGQQPQLYLQEVIQSPKAASEQT